MARHSSGQSAWVATLGRVAVLAWELVRFTALGAVLAGVAWGALIWLLLAWDGTAGPRAYLITGVGVGVSMVLGSLLTRRPGDPS